MTRSRRRWGLIGAVLLVVALAVGVGARIHERHVAESLLAAEPGAILGVPALLSQAVAIGRPQFERHCANCHGDEKSARPAAGVPALFGRAWLYGDDPVDLEHTILYGVRSGHPKARNVTDMPAIVRLNVITPDEARDAAEYVLSISKQPHDDAGAERGRVLFFNKGNCFDCHGLDAGGVTAYGTPALTGPNWIYGGDRTSLYRSISDGRHGKCPAWIDVLTPVQIRSIALYLLTAQHAPVAHN